MGCEDITPGAQFIYTSDEVKEVQETNWSAPDASLSFLRHQIQGIIRVVASSNGFLLCCTNHYENMHYIICNPITREFKTLPEPHKGYANAPLAFTCSGEDKPLDEISYEVVRAGVSTPREFTTVMKMETFSTSTGEWRESSITTATPFHLVLANQPAFVVGDVVYWKGLAYNLVAHDRAKECAQVLDMPWEDDYKVLGLSEGKIHYVRHDKKCYLETWVLEDHRRFESKAGWVMKHRVTFTTIRRENPQVRLVRPMYLRILDLHPRNSQLVLLTFHGKPYWFELGSCKLKEINGFQQSKAVYSYFRYEWPSNQLGDS